MTTKTRIINDREYPDQEFSPAELQAGAEEQFGEGFDLSMVDPAVFWREVADQMILDRTTNHPPVGYRMPRGE